MVFLTYERSHDFVKYQSVQPVVTVLPWVNVLILDPDDNFNKL